MRNFDFYIIHFGIVFIYSKAHIASVVRKNNHRITTLNNNFIYNIVYHLLEAICTVNREFRIVWPRMPL